MMIERARIRARLSGRVGEVQAASAGQFGFTLLELMVTIAIISIIIAIATNSLHDLRERTQVDSAKEQVISVLQQARLRALSTGEDQAISIDLDKNSVSYSESKRNLATGAIITTPMVTPFAQVDIQGYACSTGTLTTTGTKVFTFKRGGSVGMTGGGSGSGLRFSRPNGTDTYYVIVNTTTGRLNIKQVPGC